MIIKDFRITLENMDETEVQVACDQFVSYIRSMVISDAVERAKKKILDEVINGGFAEYAEPIITIEEI